MSRPSKSVVLLRPLAAALQARPSALTELLSAADLTPQMLADAEARVTPAQFCVAWAEALRLSGTPHLALELAAATPVGAFGIVEYVCRAAPTLGEALAHWVRFLGILDSAVEVALVESGPRAALRVVTESEAPAPASHELCFALVVQHARRLQPQFSRPAAVSFAHAAPPAHRARHRTFFGCEVQFAAKRTELVFERSDLAAPLPSADANLLEILLPTAEARRAAKTEQPLLTEQVRRALRGAFTRDEAQIEAVARKLGLTARSLQRRLRDEGSTFNDVRSEMRRELAEHYLAQGLSCPEISFMLGFSEPSAFFRAFKRWTGITPLEHRAALRPRLAT